MARGQLGVNIMAHFEAHPEAQTVKQIQDALSAPSGGAINYALDKLIGEGKVGKLEGRPARYYPNTGEPPVIPESSKTTKSSSPKRSRASQDEALRREAQEAQDFPEDTEGEPTYVSKHPCGYCMDSKPLDYHLKYCPQVIKRAAAGKDWACSCHMAGHSRASDYQEGADISVQEMPDPEMPDVLVQETEEELTEVQETAHTE